jgi:hypothetical protein
VEEEVAQEKQVMTLRQHLVREAELEEMALNLVLQELRHFMQVVAVADQEQELEALAAKEEVVMEETLTLLLMRLKMERPILAEELVALLMESVLYPAEQAVLEL